MKTANQIRREANRLFRSCLKIGRVDEDEARSVVTAILKSKRRGYLALLMQFHRFLKIELARRTAEVESAFVLPFDLRAIVETGLKRLYGDGLVAQYAHNPDLIGGMRIKVGSDVYDGSVRFAIAGLEKNLGIISINGKKTHSAP